MNFKLKNTLKKLVNNSFFSPLLNYLYLLLLRNEDKQQKILINKDDKGIIYIIRPRTDGVEGLLSLFLGVMKKIAYAEQNNFDFYIDFRNYKTQYFISENENAWEYFFKQPLLSEADLENKNYILSGFTYAELKNKSSCFSKKIFFEKTIKDKSKLLVKKYIRFSDDVLEKLKREEELLSCEVEASIGVYLRGTDYIKLKPTGEPVQPTMEQACEIIDSFTQKYVNSNIFLVTEDFNIYSFLKKRYKTKLFTMANDSFVKNYIGNDFLSKSGILAENKKNVGIDYLIKIILLSRCKYFVSSITNGSISAYLLKDGDFMDEYIFDLGEY